MWCGIILLSLFQKSGKQSLGRRRERCTGYAKVDLVGSDTAVLCVRTNRYRHTTRQADDRRHPQGDLARVLAKRPCRSAEGRDGTRSEYSMAWPAARGRSRLTGFRG